MTAEAKNILFATWEGGGSVGPALTAARKLVARGHRVRVMSDRCNRPEAEAAGAAFRPWIRAPSRPDRSRDTDPIRDWEVVGPAGISRAIDAIWAGPSLAYAQDLIEELRREPADVVVGSDMLFGVMAGCEAIGQAFVLLAANICLYPTPGVPPMGLGLPPAATAEQEAQYAEIAAGMSALLDQGLPALNAARAALGLPALAHLLEQPKAAGRLLLATSRAFDFAPATLAEHIVYVGPQLGEPAWVDAWAPPAGDDPRPRVVVAFSTSFQDHAGVLQRVIDALAALPVRGLVTLGGAIEPSELRPADNVEVVDSAPHDILMRGATLVVTHGGHGSVARALSHRLPMLLIPHGRDQNDNAVRVTARGAGLSLAPSAGTDEIREALSRLLDEPQYRVAAQALGDRVAEEIARSPVVAELEAAADRASAGRVLEPSA